MRIPPNELNLARKRLMLGGSLMQAAEIIGAGRDELDLALWRYATRRGFSANPDVRHSYIRRVS